MMPDGKSYILPRDSGILTRWRGTSAVDLIQQDSLVVVEGSRSMP